jgi:hypothetical protein
MFRRGAVGDSEAMSPGRPLDHAKTVCAICARAVEGAPLTDDRSGRVFHPECVVRRAPEDAHVRLLGFLALIAAPTVLVWAG